MLIMALLSGARLWGELSPFAPAFLCAALSRGVPGAPLLAGCMLGALWNTQTLPDIAVPLSCLTACLTHRLVRLLEKRLSFRTPPDGLCIIEAMLSAMLPALIFSGGLSYNIVTGGLNALAAGMLAPALVSGLSIRRSRRQLLPEEQLSAALLTLLGLISLCPLPRIGSFLSQTGAVLLSLIGSFAGCGMGALAGIASGSALALSGSDPFIGSSLCLCGLLAGCMREVNRPTACVVFAASSMLTVTWGLGYTLGIIEPYCLLCGSILYCLIPKKQLVRLRGWMAPRLPGADPEHLAVRVRRKAGRRLAQVSSVFGELADGCGEQTVLPDEKQLIDRLRNALCKGCSGYAECWKGDDTRAGRLMCRMAAQALCAREVTPASALPPELLRHCRRSAHIDRRITPLLQSLSRERNERFKRGEARSLMAHQFREAQNILDSLSTQLCSPICLNREYALMAQSALERAGIRCREVLALLDDRMEIVCVLREGAWNPQRAKEAARILTEETGVPFLPLPGHGRVIGECELYLVQSPALSARFACAARPREDGAPCGDSHMAALLSDGRFIAAISDGMGSGEEAARESGRCISLLRKFVTAGVDRDAALTAVNQLLLMRGGEDMFATADLCVIDLYSGMACLSKLGACRSFLLQEKGIRQISGGRLPLGILDHVEPAVHKLEVFPGDLLIMISDGIADELREGQTEALCELLPSLRDASPEEAAEQIIRWAEERDAPLRHDDMTVIAVRLTAHE